MSANCDVSVYYLCEVKGQLCTQWHFPIGFMTIKPLPSKKLSHRRQGKLFFFYIRLWNHHTEVFDILDVELHFFIYWAIPYLK